MMALSWYILMNSQRCLSACPGSWLRQFLPQMTSCDTPSAPIPGGNPIQHCSRAFQVWLSTWSHHCLFTGNWQPEGHLASLPCSILLLPCLAILSYSDFFFGCTLSSWDLTPKLIYVLSGGGAHSRDVDSAPVLADNCSLLENFTWCFPHALRGHVAWIFPHREDRGNTFSTVNSSQGILSLL